MKYKRTKIILIIVILVLLALIYIPKVIAKQTDSYTKVSNYISENYGNKVNNIKLLESKRETDDYSCDGSVFYSKKIKGSYQYYYSAYSIDDDFTFYIYYNDNNGKDIFKDTFEPCKKIKEKAQKEINYIRNNIKENIISVTYEVDDERIIFGIPDINIKIDIDANLKDIIDEKYVTLMNSLTQTISKSNFVETEGMYARICVFLNYKDGNCIRLGVSDIAYLGKNHLSDYLEGLKNGEY